MSYETDDRMVSHPNHYKSGKYEVIDIIDEFTKDLTGTEAVCTANAIKYVLRWKKKNGVQDVKKAIWYLTHLVEQLENDEAQRKRCQESIDKEDPDLCVKSHKVTCPTTGETITVPDGKPWSTAKDVVNYCSICEYESCKADEAPCKDCHGRSNWKPKESIF